MPFTFAHPTAIFPAKYLPKRLYSLTGLVVGSIIPDFEYFIRMNVGSWYSHSPLGLFWFDLPLGIIVTFIFHSIVRNKLIENFPDWLYVRFARFKLFNWIEAFKRNWPIIIISILVGAASHILWDDFTHSERYFVRHILFLRNKINIFSVVIPMYKILQQVSSFLGACLILFYIIKMPIEQKQRSRRSKIFWPLVLTITAMIVGMRFLGGLVLNQYGNVIVTLFSAFFIGLIISSLILKNTSKNYYFPIEN